MRTIKEGTRAYEAVAWMQPLVGQVRYKWWTSGPVPHMGPAWATNRPVPTHASIKRGGVFCAGVTNLLLRKVGKRIPIYGNRLYDGGTLAYAEYFAGYDEPFDLYRALQVAYDSREPVLLIDPFVSSARQGHVAVVLPSGYLLQSYDEGEGWPGLNWNIRTEQSVQYWTPQRMVLARNWINYSGDEF
jgi:hypothetical protein